MRGSLESANGVGVSTFDCPEKSDEEKKEFIRSCLNKQFAITITDGRTVVGDFLCTDKDANIILGGTQEYAPGRPGC